MPITDSFGRRRNDVCGSQSCWVDRGGRIILPRVHVLSVCGVLAGTAAYNEKSGPCPATANLSRVQLPRSGATFLMLLHFPGFLNLADHHAADSGGGRPSFSNVRAWPPGGERLRADAWAVVPRPAVPFRQPMRMLSAFTTRLKFNAGVAGVLSNSGSGHALTHHFAVFGYHVTGSTGTLFLYGIVVGALGLVGLSLLLARAPYLPPRQRGPPRTYAVPPRDGRRHRGSRRPARPARDRSRLHGQHAG